MSHTTSVQAESQFEILKTLLRARDDLQHEIMATPSGPRRNALCDSQIHLNSAIDCLKPILDMSNPEDVGGSRCS